MTTPRTGQWNVLQKIAPVIVGLGILVLVGSFWCWYRFYKRRKSSRRAQDMYPGMDHSPTHRRNESAASYSSTTRLNASQLSLPVHRVRFFFSGMLPVRERQRNSDWNIEGEPRLPRRSSVAYDPSSRRESDSLFTHAPSMQNDTPPNSPVTNWSPLQTISRWWMSANPSKSKDYQSVHLLSTRKNSKFGNDDDNHPEPAFVPPSPQNEIRNGRASEEGVSSVLIISNGERQSVSHPRSPHPEPESPNTDRLPSLRPNRPGHIVATEDPSHSQPLSPADVSEFVST